MSLFPSRQELKFCHDVSLLPAHPFQALDATTWKCAALINPTPARFFEGGHTITVIDSPLFSWLRTYTQSSNPPPETSCQALAYLEEWIPGREPSAAEKKDWLMMPNRRALGIYFLDPKKSYLDDWSELAKRHLKRLAKEPKLTQRLGNLDEIRKAYKRSQVPRDMREVMICEVERHLAAHPDAIEVLVAEHADLGIVGGFVSGNCDQALQSIYLLGFFTPEARQLPVMRGLVDMWYKRSLARGYRTVNFGLMVGPRPFFLDSMIGFSVFKTHFGVHRAWSPPSFWRLKSGG